MAEDARGADGRLFTRSSSASRWSDWTAEEVAAPELSRELGIARSLLQQWKALLTTGGETASTRASR